MIGSTKPRHANVALFVPHVGCPHRCSFCNQRVISGKQQLPTPADVTAACERALATLPVESAQAEIAFFGGSFTLVPEDYQNALLEVACAYVKAGHFAGIRLSTRPDGITPAILERLCGFGVTAVELGAQSMDDRVLMLNERGHTAADVVTASRLIKEYGLSLGLQMMTGLPGSTPQTDLQTAQVLCGLHPDTMRIYPTLVVEHTRLADWYRQGKYTPQTQEEGVALAADLLRLVEWERGIPVIRLGLHAEQELSDHWLAGPYHPAFRELCESRLYAALVEEELQNLPNTNPITLLVHPSSVSKVIGQKRSNLIRWQEAGYTVRVKADPTVHTREIRVMDVNL